ncbi:MAG: hypothetical protein GY771_17500, partial [bacterium]|nr:hypothetical protein [bacterium]
MTPRGIEILVKKASVDGAFRRHLLTERSGAAERIGLELDPAEAAMLDAIPEAQLVATIEKTKVTPLLRPAFTGYAAAAMLAAGGGVAGCGEEEIDTDKSGLDERSEEYNIINEEPKRQHLYGVTGIRPGMILSAISKDTTAPISAKLELSKVDGPGKADPNRYIEELSITIEPCMEDVLYEYYAVLNEYPDFSFLKLVFSFDIIPDGSVNNIRIPSISADNITRCEEFYGDSGKELILRVINIMREWRFSRASEQVTVA